jgi:glyoxylase-like metal-dependent hydrolase (beta-lactamase superfamily II)
MAPEEVLAHLGFSADQVDTVVLTHHHFDHAANLRAFPNATFYIQRRDVHNLMDKLATPARMRWLASGLDPNTVAALADVAYDGRLRLLDGAATILPGLEVRPAFGTHTDGSQYLLLDSSDGTGLPLLLSGDAVMVEENLLGMERDGVMLPIGLSQGGQEADIRIMEEMMGLVDGDVQRILPFHETRIWERSPSVTIQNGLHIAEFALARGASSRLPGEYRDPVPSVHPGPLGG